MTTGEQRWQENAGHDRIMRTQSQFRQRRRHTYHATASTAPLSRTQLHRTASVCTACRTTSATSIRTSTGTQHTNNRANRPLLLNPHRRRGSSTYTSLGDDRFYSSSCGFWRRRLSGPRPRTMPRASRVIKGPSGRTSRHPWLGARIGPMGKSKPRRYLWMYMVFFAMVLTPFTAVLVVILARSRKTACDLLPAVAGRRTWPARGRRVASSSAGQVRQLGFPDADVPGSSRKARRRDRTSAYAARHGFPGDSQLCSPLHKRSGDDRSTRESIQWQNDR